VLLRDCPALADPARTLLGREQEQWLADGWSPDHPWNLLAQQTLMARYTSRPEGRYWTDGWDGYAAARQRLPATVVERLVPGLVVLGGGEDKEVCAIKQLYAELAHDCGLEMPAGERFGLSPKLAAFGGARFDRERGLRVPVLSLTGVLQVDFRLPGSADYTALPRATRLLTRDEREVAKAYARAVFNVLFHNRDDHPKNVAWRLGCDRRWRLAPAFDLSFSDGPRGQHHMDLCGEAGAVERHHLLALAAERGVPAKAAQAAIDRMLAQAAAFAPRAAAAPIRRATVRRMTTVADACRARLARP
jgi:serine/threonine-protein kinase HipA